LDLWIRGKRRAFYHAQALAAHLGGAAQRSSRPHSDPDRQTHQTGRRRARTGLMS